MQTKNKLAVVEGQLALALSRCRDSEVRLKDSATYSARGDQVCVFFLSLSLSLSLSFSFSLTISLSLSRTHAHTHIHSLSFSLSRIASPSDESK